MTVIEAIATKPNAKLFLMLNNSILFEGYRWDLSKETLQRKISKYKVSFHGDLIIHLSQKRKRR